MSEHPEKPGEQPIIIVRRPRGGHDEHHGGAWKIAYADFMTAMMALFLVMWLVNASSEETKAAVASYFNPIDLTDRNARPRGVDEPTDISAPVTEGREDGRHDAAARPGPDGAREIARAEGGTPADQARDMSLPVAPSATAREGDEPADAANDALADPLSTEASRTEGSRTADIFDPFALGVAPPALPVVASPVVPAERVAAAERPVADDPGEPAPATARPSVSPPVSTPETTSVPTPEAAREASAIAAELADTLAAEIDVIAQADTVVIRLADDPERGMFALGSSVPRAGLEADLARVAASLAGRPGTVSVHGHTDARPFAAAGGPRGALGDGNWRLSAERAGTAHALLVAGGLDGARVARVVAHADRDPRDPDALSPRNRRIEVRLALGGGNG